MLPGCHLIELPPAIRELPALAELELRDNQLQQLPAGRYLGALKTLILDDNRLTGVPEVRLLLQPFSDACFVRVLFSSRESQRAAKASKRDLGG